MSAYKMRFFQTGHNGYTLKLVNNATTNHTDLLMTWLYHLNVNDYLQMPKRIDTVMRVNIPPTISRNKQLEVFYRTNK